MIVVQDCTPMMADVVSGAVPRPRPLEPGEDPATWALNTPALRRLRLADIAPNAGGDLQDLADALGGGDDVTFLHHEGRIIALNVDGTRAAFYAAGGTETR